RDAVVGGLAFAAIANDTRPYFSRSPDGEVLLMRQRLATVRVGVSHPFQLFEPDLRRLPVAESIRERASPVLLQESLQVVEVRIVKQVLFDGPRPGET